MLNLSIILWEVDAQILSPYTVTFLRQIEKTCKELIHANGNFSYFCRSQEKTYRESSRQVEQEIRKCEVQ